ncbi:MAG: oligosaccharide flippase family protein [Candidatus Sedimenticola sp. 20ELBAFRAG]
MGENQFITKRLISGGLWTTLNQVVFAVLTLLVNALVTRLLTQEEVGAYFLITSITVFGHLVILLGTNKSVIKLVASGTVAEEGKGVRPAIKGTAVLVAVMGILVVSVYQAGIGEWLGNHVFNSRIIGELSLLTGLLMFLRASQLYLSSTLLGFHKMGLASLINQTLTVFLVVGVLGYISLTGVDSEIDDVLLVVLAGHLLTVFTAIYLLSSPYRASRKDTGVEIQGALDVGLPLSILAISITGIQEAHVWILGAFTNETQVAIYGIAFRLSKFVLFPLIVVNSVISSTVAQLWAQGEEKRLERILRAGTTMQVIPSVVIVLVLVIGGEEILGWLFGTPYAAGTTALLVIIAGQLVSSIVGSPGVLIAMSGNQRVSMVFGITSGVMGIIISMLGVGSYGSVGVAAGVASGVVINNLLSWAYCWKVIGIRTHVGLQITRDLLEFIGQAYSRKRRVDTSRDGR